MTEMPNRQFWIETAILGTLMLAISFGFAVYDVKNGTVGFWLVGSLPLGAVYVYKLIKWRQRRKCELPKEKQFKGN